MFPKWALLSLHSLLQILEINFTVSVAPSKILFWSLFLSTCHFTKILNKNKVALKLLARALLTGDHLYGEVPWNTPAFLNPFWTHTFTMRQGRHSQLHWLWPSLLLLCLSPVISHFQHSFIRHCLFWAWLKSFFLIASFYLCVFISFLYQWSLSFLWLSFGAKTEKCRYHWHPYSDWCLPCLFSFLYWDVSFVIENVALFRKSRHGD